MNFLKQYPEELKAASSFVEIFKNCKEPLLETASLFQTDEDKIAWILFGSAIQQDLNYSEWFLLLKQTLKIFNISELWNLPVPRKQDFSKILTDNFPKKNWLLKEHFPGIFWSVGLFVRNHSPLKSWVESRNAKELWRDLGEIYFMGKQALRPKVCNAIYKIIASPPYGLGIFPKPQQPDKKAKHVPYPLNMGTRRFLAMLLLSGNVKFSDLEKREKQKLAEAFYLSINKENPIAVAYAFQFFLENAKNGFICKSFTSNCKKCPLQKFCFNACQ